MSETTEPDQDGPALSLRDLEYDLPEELIAQHPPAHREDARLLVADRRTQTIEDHTITDLPGLLACGDLLVMNDTKVIPAKVTFYRESGGRVRGLFLDELDLGRWRVMLEGSRRLRPGERLTPKLDGETDASITLVESLGQGQWIARVEPLASAEVILGRIGQTPLPPYIKRRDSESDTDQDDRERYQTVYASRSGAVAAPTAGLHLSKALLGAIESRGTPLAFVTLHVGIGTFKPIEHEHIEEHPMHREAFEITTVTADALSACRQRHGRIVAVGTTTVRVLETASQARRAGAAFSASQDHTDIFIYPPYEFRGVDVLLTNFHLPKSTLLALVMAFGGIDFIRRCYRHAVDRRYRFFSYGDAMLIL